MQIAIPEMHKKDGVCYAVTDDGVELPVIDVTTPGLCCRNQRQRTGSPRTGIHPDSYRRQTKLSAFVQNVVMKFMAKNSIIMRGHHGCSRRILERHEHLYIETRP